jgi:hypothetical protein
LGIVVVAVGAVFVLLFFGGVVYTILRERRTRARDARQIAAADRALETARAADRGWDRELLERAARQTLAAERPDLRYDSLSLVLVEDGAGVEEDRAHLPVSAASGDVRVILCRDDRAWPLERLA